MESTEEKTIRRPIIHVPDIVDPADENRCDGCEKRKAK